MLKKHAGTMLALGLCLSFQGCSQKAMQALGIDGNQKARVVQNTSFENEEGSREPGSSKVVVKFVDEANICSNSQTSRVSYNLKSMQQPVLRYRAGNGESAKTASESAILCEIDATQIRLDIINTKKANFPICGSVEQMLKTNQSVSVSLEEKTISNTGLIPIRSQTGNVLSNERAGWSTSSEGEIIFSSKVVYDENKRNEGTNDEKCDEIHSPLAIHFDDAPIKLTAPLDGVYFDIEGERGLHQKQLISWITTPKTMFLALPDDQGEVLGIDQLFGNNTMGPDGAYADDGFAALAKFDSNHDGLISSADKVFESLRLWSDKNLDGDATSDELLKLSEMRLMAIDLTYDPNYRREDVYGNKILLKSVVKDFNENYFPIFDIWFREI
jgi:hypothetical protein